LSRGATKSTFINICGIYVCRVAKYISTLKQIRQIYTYYTPYNTYYTLLYTYYTPNCTYLIYIYTYSFEHFIHFGTTLNIYSISMAHLASAKTEKKGHRSKDRQKRRCINKVEFFMAYIHAVKMHVDYNDQIVHGNPS
jgi:hypothetical protein